MKDNGSSKGGRLLKEYYGSYARYFVKYIVSMAAEGIRIDAVTIQNEPQHGGNVPSMLMSAEEQTVFIRDHLGPALRAAGLNTRIIIWDHNCNRPEYPIAVLNDPVARTYIDGTAFHLYEGGIEALSVVREAHPDKNLYFTEQWTGAKGRFGDDLKWHVRHVIIGSMRNWARVALEWNLASDPDYRPHTPGGCTECKGALTISGDSLTRNVSYHIIAHASKFVPAGSVRIASDESPGLPNVAFERPDGKKVLIVLNERSQSLRFNISTGSLTAAAELPAGAVGTFVW
jgi:glucosylceramidase